MTLHSLAIPTTTDLRYFILDHLGSVSVVMDASGTVAERDSYDVWGRRRYADGTDDPAGAITSVTTKCYIGHEMIDEIGLINLKGRVQDPVLAKFVSADPNVTDPFDGQSFNRFAYAINNPLSYTDPSGFDYLPGTDSSIIADHNPNASCYGDCAGYGSNYGDDGGALFQITSGARAGEVVRMFGVGSDIKEITFTAKTTSELGRWLKGLSENLGGSHFIEVLHTASFENAAPTLVGAPASGRASTSETASTSSMEEILVTAPRQSQDNQGTSNDSSGPYWTNSPKSKPKWVTVGTVKVGGYGPINFFQKIRTVASNGQQFRIVSASGGPMKASRGASGGPGVIAPAAGLYMVREVDPGDHVHNKAAVSGDFLIGGPASPMTTYGTMSGLSTTNSTLVEFQFGPTQLTPGDTTVELQQKW